MYSSTDRIYYLSVGIYLYDVLCMYRWMDVCMPENSSKAKNIINDMTL